MVYAHLENTTMKMHEFVMLEMNAAQPPRQRLLMPKKKHKRQNEHGSSLHSSGPLLIPTGE